MPNLLSPSLILTSLLTWLPICTQAHMQMSSPYPLRSPLDPDIPWYEKDYDMTTPLFADGSNFACKHYQTDDDSYAIKATYVAGGTYQMSVAGTASHKGGSCQLSLSYDNGHSFKVIKSIIGGCPLSNTYSFTVPENAPSSESVLFSWSWFNIVGNREMYQNCARVKIISGPNQRFKRELSTKRQYSPLTQLPDMFVCNVNNGCKTIEQREVVFPDPGTDVSYGQNEITPDPGPGFVITGSSSSTTTVSMATTGTTSLTSAGTTGATTTGSTTLSRTTSTPPFPFLNSTTTAAGLTGTGTGASSTGTNGPILTITGSLTSTFDDDALLTSSTTSLTTPSSATTAVMTSTTLTTSGQTTTAPTTFLTTTSTPITSPSSTFPTTTATTSPSATAVPQSCVPGTFTCNSVSTFSQCVSTSTSSTTYVYMGSVAAGMQCSNGQIIRQNDGPCTPSGSIFCNGLSAFYMCDQGGLINMGPVAPGTECRNGEIGFPQ